VILSSAEVIKCTADLDMFVEAGRTSSLPRSDRFDGQAPRTWNAALTLLASALPDDRPSVVVLDELPYLIANDPGLEGTLQKVFDRELSRRPVLLIGIGSDLAMMEALDDYGRPFHQRATEMVVSPLSPRDVADMLQLSAADAVDAYLVSGGLPLVLDEWQVGATVAHHLADTVTDPPRHCWSAGSGRSPPSSLPTPMPAGSSAPSDRVSDPSPSSPGPPTGCPTPPSPARSSC